MKNKIKRIILIIKEKIYFKDVKKIKTSHSSLIIPVEKTNINLNKASYHEYYMKYKKTA